MSTKIFVNLPVKDLGKSIDFFTKLGFSFDPQFTDENAGCLVISDDIYAMLLVERFFQSFTNKEIVDARKSTEAILALGVESPERVDALPILKSAGAHATHNPNAPSADFMYTRSFEDLDGHLWQVLYVDAAAVLQA